MVGDSRQKPATPKCFFLHPGSERRTDECRLFLEKSVRERSDLVKERRACFNSLNIAHTSRTCKSRKQCQQKECGRNHDTLLHDSHFQRATQQTNSFSAKCNLAGETCLLQIMPIEIITPTQSRNIISFGTQHLQVFKFELSRKHFENSSQNCFYCGNTRPNKKKANKAVHVQYKRSRRQSRSR